MPEESTEGIIFSELEITYPMVVLQYSLAWEIELLRILDLQRDDATICPLPLYSPLFFSLASCIETCALGLGNTGVGSCRTRNILLSI